MAHTLFFFKLADKEKSIALLQSRCFVFTMPRAKLAENLPKGIVNFFFIESCEIIFLEIVGARALRMAKPTPALKKKTLSRTSGYDRRQ